MIKVGDCREYNDERERELPQLLQVSRFKFRGNRVILHKTSSGEQDSVHRLMFANLFRQALGPVLQLLLLAVVLV